LDQCIAYEGGGSFGNAQAERLAAAQAGALLADVSRRLKPLRPQMGFLDALSTPKSHWDKIKKEASSVFYDRMNAFSLSGIGVPEQVIQLYRGNKQLETELKNALVIYFSCSTVWIERCLFQTNDSGLQNYQSRVKSLTARSVIDLASALYFYFIVAYDSDDPQQSCAGFYAYGAAYGYKVSDKYLSEWLSLKATLTPLSEPERIDRLNARLGDEFARVLGLNPYSGIEMVDLCCFEHALSRYALDLLSQPGDWSSLVKMLMKPL
jgi:hypothetical protein